MSVIRVSNVNFESTANNQLVYSANTVALRVGGTQVLGQNSTAMAVNGAIVLGNSTVNAVVNSIMTTYRSGNSTYTHAYSKHALRNRVINGAMMVSQENGNTAGTASGYYPVDQFNLEQSHDGAVSLYQAASATQGGSPNRVRLTVTSPDTSLAATQYAAIRTNIEGQMMADFLWGTASAKQVVFRFGVKAPQGTYCLAIRASGATRSYAAEYTISAGESNVDTVKTIAIPGDTTGTWLTDTSLGCSILWCLGTGTTFQTSPSSWAAGNYLGTSNQYNFLGTNANVFELFDVGLYLDSGTTGIAPKWELPLYDVELRKCQRYFVSYGGTALYERIAPLYITASTSGSCTIRFIVPMRSAPAITVSNVSHFGVFDGVGSGVVTTMGSGSSGKLCIFATVTCSGGGLTQSAGSHLYINNTLSGRLFINARM